ncbi:LemA family protein [Verrucomicrobia bacterium]|nr:LemA family protein [Verrucomicrobiota bacterium]
MAFALIPSLISLALLFWWRSVILFKRTVEDVPTSKVKGVFYGLNEVKGSVKSDDPLQTYLTEAPSVWYEWKISEHWKKTESYRDKDGNRKTRTKSGWRTVDSGGSYQSFFLKDETGELLIEPEGAKVDAPSTMSHACSPSDPLYYGKGPDGAIANSTYRRRFSEHSLTPGDDLYVLGPAKLREDVAQPMIAKSKEARYYFISTKSEAQIIRSKSIWAFFIMLFSFVAALAVPVVAITVETGMEPLEVFREKPGWVVLSGMVFLAVAGLFYLSLLYNGLIRVRNRLTHALGLIEIQLKRRYDLIPRLLECVQGISEYEREVQKLVASVRSSAGNLAGREAGEIGEEISQGAGLVGGLFALSEKYPNLSADQNYASFMKELVDTEDRIALARAFYNDSLLALQDRLLTFPDVLVAKWFRFRAGKNLGLLPDPEMAQVPRVSL